MSEMWFRARTGEEGTGYTVSGAKGVIASVAFVVVTTASAVLPSLLTNASAFSLVLGAVLVVVEIAVFLRLVRQHSDWRG
jgi:inner membrane protein involved in colicin E2 resistance